jgi:hypothetical protein
MQCFQLVAPSAARSLPTVLPLLLLSPSMALLLLLLLSATPPLRLLLLLGWAPDVCAESLAGSDSCVGVVGLLGSSAAATQCRKKTHAHHSSQQLNK